MVACDFITKLLEGLLSTIYKGISLVLEFHFFFSLLVFISEFFCVFDLAVYLIRSHLKGRRDGHLLFLACSEVFGSHMKDAVGIYIECNLYLRNSARCRRYTDKIEPAKCNIVIRHRPLTPVSYTHL